MNKFTFTILAILLLVSFALAFAGYFHPVIPAAAGIYIILAFISARKTKRSSCMKHGTILPAKQMKSKYNLYAKKFQQPILDIDKIPTHLHDLIPLAQKWGIGDDIIREDLEQNTSEYVKQELAKKLSGRMSEITNWLDSFDNDEVMTDEAMCFMYMQQAIDEMQIWPDN